MSDVKKAMDAELELCHDGSRENKSGEVEAVSWLSVRGLECWIVPLNLNERDRAMGQWALVLGPNRVPPHKKNIDFKFFYKNF